MTILFILRGWGAAFLRWIIEPKAELVRRGEKLEKARLLREAQKAIRRG